MTTVPNSTLQNIATCSDGIKLFVELSNLLSGFESVELWGTGMVEAYYDEVNLIIGEREMGKLLGAFTELGNSQQEREGQIESQILNSDRYGPVARNIIRLWYLGAWQQLPREWRNLYGATSFDTDHIVSAKSYQESLVWIAGGAHPMGAKQQGFGAWAKKPEAESGSGAKS